MKDIFEPGSLYVELQDHGLPEQPVLNGILVDLARELDLPLVATNDVHYAERERRRGAPLSLVHQDGALVRGGEGAPSRLERDVPEVARRDGATLFAAHPEAVANTIAIAERCRAQAQARRADAPELPGARRVRHRGLLPPRRARGARARASRSSKRRQEVDREAYASASSWELDVIAKMKFPGYFLIVWDFIRYAKENGIPVGPGRGSGAGSLVAYAMRITDLDPIPYNLLFERFLNPERVSHAGLRRRLLHGPARRGHRVRAEEVRRRERRADRDVRRAEGARASSRTSRAASASRRSRRSRSRT